MRYLILIPARGGSKGLPRKNIYPICGKPMIDYTLSLLKEIKWSGDVVVSTDDEEIIKISKELTDGSENFYVIKRPAEYAEDTSSTEDVAIHAVNYMKESYGKEYDVLVTMAPNLPVRTKEMFFACIDSFEHMPEEFDSQVCFCRTDEDLWRKMEDGEYRRMNPDAPRRRQDREPLYVEKGSMTMSKISALFSTGSLWGKKVHGFEIEEKNAIDVHDINDVHYLEYLLADRNG